MIPMKEHETRLMNGNHNHNDNEMNRRRFRKGTTSALLVVVFVFVVMAAIMGSGSHNALMNMNTSMNTNMDTSTNTSMNTSTNTSMNTGSNYNETIWNQNKDIRRSSSANGEAEIEIETGTSSSSSDSNADSTMSPTRENFKPRCCQNENQTEKDYDEYEYDYEAPEPFRYLHDCCDDCNPSVPESPDPLVSVTWDLNQYNHNHNHKNNDTSDSFVGTPLQIYRTSNPVALYTIPSDASVVVADRESQTTGKTPRLLVLESCTIVMDWGSERAAWFEIQSHDNLVSHANANANAQVKVTASISEYNRPYPGKTRSLQKYGNHTYRLETNKELYEGVRFTFLHVSFPNNDAEAKTEEETTATSNTKANANANANANTALAIDDFSIVSKVKPIDYTGSFRSSHKLLTKAWYWGAYGARLNVEQSQINSILIERGDRVAIQGDGHPTIAALLAVFYSDEMVVLLSNVLNETDNAHKHVVDDSIMAYPLYWCLSAMDYYWATFNGNNGIDDSFADQYKLVADIRILLDKRIDDFLDPNLNIHWFGWDDRVGNGWCYHSDDACTREGHLAFAGLVIMVCNDLVDVLKSLVVLILDESGDTRKGDADAEQMKALVKKYDSHAKKMSAALRNIPEYPSEFGVHAAANAINANVATEQEIEQHWMGTADNTNTLNNAVTICSFSQFNQYWILQALGNIGGDIGGIEHALKSIDLCWGPMMELSTGGCFWELSSREWLSFMNEGDQAPHLPSYCHPWASGVTPWLSKVMGGTHPFRPGYSEFIALPYVSETYSFVNSTTPTPHGPITVSARLSPPLPKANNEHQQSASSKFELFQFQFEATIDANIPGLFGLRKSVILKKSSSEAPLKIETVKVNGIPIAPHDILDLEQAPTLFEGSGVGGSKNHQRTKEHYFLRLGTNNGSDRSRDGASISYVVTAQYQAVGHRGSGRGATPALNTAAAIRHRSLSKTITTIHTSTTDDSDDDDFSPFPIPNYPSSILEPFDSKSQGDGLLQYGKDGFLLLGCNHSSTYNDTETDVDMLPAYIKEVTIRRHGFPGWVVPKETLVGYSDTDPVYLPDPGDGNNTRKRVLGMVGIDDKGGGDINCILVDVTFVAPPTPQKQQPQLQSQSQHHSYYFLSIYFVAVRPENKHAIRVMDGDTYDVIAPTTLIEDYMGGVWWTLRTSIDRSSVRLKMMDIDGIHLSAIAFATDLSSPS